MQIESILSFVGAYKYLLLTFVAIIEGPIVMMSAGLFVHSGQLSFLPSYIALMVGDLIGDMAWYGVGYYGGERFVHRFGTYFSITEESVGKVQAIFKRHHEKILLLSKMTMGLGFALATLVVAGMSRISVSKYLAINALGQLFWSALLMGIGYYFGYLYLTINSLLIKATAFAALVILFLAYQGFRKYIKERLSHG